MSDFSYFVGITLVLLSLANVKPVDSASIPTMTIGILIEDALEQRMNISLQLNSLFSTYVKNRIQALLMSWDQLDMEIKTVVLLPGLLPKIGTNTTFLISLGSQQFASRIDQFFAKTNSIFHVAILVDNYGQAGSTKQKFTNFTISYPLTILAYPQIMNDLLQLAKARNVAFITSLVNESHYDSASSFLTSFQFRNDKSLTFRKATIFSNKLLKLLVRDGRHFIVVGADDSLSVLREADKLSSLSLEYYWWLLPLKDISLSDVETFLQTRNLSKKWTFNKPNVVMLQQFCLSNLCENLGEESAATTFIRTIRSKLKALPEIWTRIYSAIFAMYESQLLTTQNSKDSRKNLTVAINDLCSTVYVYTSQGSGTDINLKLAASIKYKWISNTTRNSVVSNVLQEGMFYNRFLQFPDNTTLIAITGENYFMTVGGTDMKGFLINVTGSWYDILTDVASRLNFKVKIRFSKDMKYGSFINGTWNGIVKDIIDEIGDIGFGPITMTPDRSTAISFTSPVMEISQNLLLPQPQQITSLFQMFFPYENIVWIAILISLVITSVILTLYSKLSPFSAWNLGLQDAILDEVSFPENAWASVGTILQQGQDFHPNAASARVLMYFWWTFCVVILASYTANLTAYLSITPMEASINTIEDLLKQDKIHVAYIQGSNVESLLKESAPNTIYRKLYDASPAKNGFPSRAIALQKVAVERKWALIDDKTSTAIYDRQSCTSFTTSKDAFNMATFAWMLPLRSPYLERFNEVLTNMVQSGAISRINNNFTKQLLPCSNTEPRSDTLTLRAVSGAFIVLGASVILAWFILLCEYALHFFRKNRK